jgi:hypothetical protein
MLDTALCDKVGQWKKFEDTKGAIRIRDLRQDSSFLRVLLFPPTIKLTATI